MFADAGEGARGRRRSMSNLIVQPGHRAPIVPRASVSIRVAAMSDFAFIDALQKKHRSQVGFLQRAALESYIERGEALIAEEADRHGGRREHTGHADVQQAGSAAAGGSQPSEHPENSVAHASLGYVIAKDRYFKRDDCGIIFQLNVMPGSQRKLVGAALVQEVFRRAAYGCKLFCCWCAQDIEANRFWESMGFVPLAFRAGSSGRKRVHVFWQRRIEREEGLRNTGQTPVPLAPYWYPCTTNAGAIREDRVVLPIPPGLRWDDAMPVIASSARQAGRVEDQSIADAEEGKPLLRTTTPGKESDPSAGACSTSNPTPRKKSEQQGAARDKSESGAGTGGAVRRCPAGKMPVVSGGKIRYVDRPGGRAEAAAPKQLEEPAPPPPRTERKSRRPKVKNDARLAAMARELRDRYLEQVNSGAIELDHGAAKYEVGRGMEEHAAERRGASFHPLPGAAGQGPEAIRVVTPCRLLEAA